MSSIDQPNAARPALNLSALIGRARAILADRSDNRIAQKMAGTVFLVRVGSALLASKQMGALGVKIHVAGRLGGAEMARRETVSFGSVPLSTLRADVDFGYAIARTTYGVIGCKAWVYRGMHPVKERKRPKVGMEVSHGHDA